MCQAPCSILGKYISDETDKSLDFLVRAEFDVRDR